MRYRDHVESALTPLERKLFSRLGSPQKIQDYLDTLPINFKETYYCPRIVVRKKVAHCFEGALFAAAVLAYHGERPLLLDLRTTDEDEDHVVTLFRQNGYWGAISKTNHAVLRYRDPVYATLRELALSFFHEYFHFSGRKSLRMVSKPFSLMQYHPEDWIATEDSVEWVAAELDESPHFPVVPKKNIKVLRNAPALERTLVERTEWKAPRGFKRASF